MSIEKKSLISTLKTTKKANVASAPGTFDGVTRTETLKVGTQKVGTQKVGTQKIGTQKGRVQEGIV